MAAKKRSKKRTTKKNPTKKSRPRRAAAKKTNPTRRRRRRHNPDWGHVAKSGLLAAGGVLIGAIAYGGVAYVMKDIDLSPTIRGGAMTIGGVVLAGLHPWQTELMLGAGGIVAALGVSEIAGELMGTKDKAAPAPRPIAVNASSFLPESQPVRGIQVPLSPRQLRSPASELANGDYHGIKVPDFLY